MGALEILIILLVAFIFLGPERMVDAARTLGRWTGELRRMSAGVQAEINGLSVTDVPQAEQRRAPATPNRSQASQPAEGANDAPDDIPTEDGPVAFRSGARIATAPPADDAPQPDSRERKP